MKTVIAYLVFYYTITASGDIHVSSTGMTEPDLVKAVAKILELFPESYMDGATIRATLSSYVDHVPDAVRSQQLLTDLMGAALDAQTLRRAQKSHPKLTAAQLQEYVGQVRKQFQE
jgi:hypothetical protein